MRRPSTFRPFLVVLGLFILVALGAGFAVGAAGIAPIAAWGFLLAILVVFVPLLVGIAPEGAFWTRRK